jgi:CYTH domain-containing protein
MFIPVISLGVWISTEWLTHWVLSHSYYSTSQLQTIFYPNTQVSQTLTITSIDVRVDHRDNIAEVTITTAHSTLQRLEFKFPFTGETAFEIALANELNTTADVITALIRYRIE